MDISLCCAARCSGAPGRPASRGYRRRSPRPACSDPLVASGTSECPLPLPLPLPFPLPLPLPSALPSLRAARPARGPRATDRGRTGRCRCRGSQEHPRPGRRGGAAAQANDPCSGATVAAGRRPDRMSSRMRIRPRSMSSASANAMPANLMTSLSLERRATWTRGHGARILVRRDERLRCHES